MIVELREMQTTVLGLDNAEWHLVNDAIDLLRRLLPSPAGDLETNDAARAMIKFACENPGFDRDWPMFYRMTLALLRDFGRLVPETAGDEDLRTVLEWAARLADPNDNAYAKDIGAVKMSTVRAAHRALHRLQNKAVAPVVPMDAGRDRMDIPTKTK